MTGKRAALGATMSDVARIAGVSDMTVSNVFRRPERVAEATRQRVVEAARSVGYVLNEVAGNLSSGRTRTIAAVVPSLSSSYFFPVLQGVIETLRPTGYQLMLAHAGFRPAEEEAAVEAFLRRRPDGIILTGTRHTTRTRTMLRSAGIPVVETWEIDAPLIDMAVGYSHRDTSAALTRLLLAKGHRAIGYIDHPESPVRRHRQRRVTISATLEAAGLRGDRIIALPAVGGFGGGRQAFAELITRWPEVTAVIGATDAYAAGAVFESQRRGLAVPHDIAICGFGNAEIGREMHPTLTTVDTHSHTMGGLAARMILSRLGEIPGDVDVLQDVGFDVIEREST